MGRDDNANHDPEDKRSRGRGRRRDHSGYGMESIRPLLRAQLEEQDLLRLSSFPSQAEKDKSSGNSGR